MPYERELNYRTVAQVLEEKYHLDPDEAKDLADFLAPMLEFEPAKRARAREMIEHPWLKV